MTSFEQVEKQLRNLEPVYAPRGEAAAVIGGVVLENLIGPYGAGKSTIAKRMTELDSAFSVPFGITTREPRIGEKLKHYRHIPHTAQGLEEILQKANAGELVQFTFHKVTQRIYGTESQDYATRYAVLDMVYNYVEHTHRLGFKDVVDVAIVSSVHDYAIQTQQHARLINDPEQIEERRQEGILSLEWCLDHKDDIAWVHNRRNQVDLAALEVISLAKGEARSNQDNWRLGAKMLEYLKSKPFRSIG